MKAFFKKYENIKVLILFFIVYMLGFLLLENRTLLHSIVTSTRIDQYIPFNEYFVIPYLLWFVFMILGFSYFIFIDQDGFKRTAFYLFLGMMICLLIYALFPSEQDLRVTLNNENLFQILVSLIYSIDSPTNVCPSIHVYNSIMMTISLLKSPQIKNQTLTCILIIIIAIFICASTVLIKQHAFIDIVWAIILAIIMYKIGQLRCGY